MLGCKVLRYLCWDVLSGVSESGGLDEEKMRTIALSGMKRSPRTNTNLEVMIVVYSCLQLLSPLSLSMRSTWKRECLAADDGQVGTCVFTHSSKCGEERQRES